MERITRRRISIILAIFCLILGGFALRLYSLQVVESDGNADNVKKYYSVTRVKAARGDILDQNGNVLVTNRATYNLVFNSFVIISAPGTNDHLFRLVQTCRELGIEYADHFPVSKDAPFTYTLSDYNATWQGYFQAYLPERGNLDSDIAAPILMRKLRELYRIPESWSEADARAVIGLRYELDLRGKGITNLPNYVFLEDADNVTLSAILELGIPGLTTEESMVRVYNTKYAAHILGFTSAISPDQWEEYKGKGYAMDAEVGQSGFELAFEDYLHGTDGTRVDVVTSDGTLVDQYYKRDEDGNEMRPVAGKNVEVTIDMNLQATAEDQLSALISSLRVDKESLPEGSKIPDGGDVEGGAVVVMDVKTGKVLACASYPTYDLTTFRENYDELKDAPFAPMYNRALQAIYPPGSTYKMSMVVAAIDSGVITGSDKILTKGVFTKYPNFSPKCLHFTKHGTTHGLINARDALCVSCNYFFYELGDQISQSAMDATAKALGLGEKSGIELFEETGYRANPETKAKLFTGDKARWYRADQIMAAIGQSENRFTPIQLCNYTATLANRGTRYQATFLNRVISADHQKLEFVNTPQIVSQLQISDDAYKSYTEGMLAVSKEGTARSIFWNYPVAVASKTGTAETDSGGSDNGSFVCYAPFDDPQIAIAVYGEKAGHGFTLGNIAKEILNTYFGTSDVTIPGENHVN